MTVTENSWVCLAPSPRLRDDLTDFTQFSRIFPHIVYNKTRPIVSPKLKVILPDYLGRSNYLPDKTYYERLLYIAVLDLM